jgi:hypothetical protein
VAFRREQERHPELATPADRWEAHVLDAYRRGHDVQLHLHSQWSEAKFDDGRWTLNGSWSLLRCNAETVRSMISEGKAYLEGLIGGVDPAYSCVAFRGSYLAVAPSPFLLDVLAELGIEVDLSIVGGLRVNTRHVDIDYTKCEEDFLPFYPEMNDARRVSAGAEPIVCVPIFHFTGSRLNVAAQIASKVTRRLAVKADATTGTGADDPSAETGRSSMAARVADKVMRPILFGKHLTADVGQLGLPLLREMMAELRKKAARSGLTELPVVLTNHTKNMRDFEGFDRFLGELSTSDDIRFITARELAAKIRSGEFAVRTQSKLNLAKRVKERS